MGQTPTLHILYTCPFCWKVRGVIEHIGMDVDYVPVNGMKIKKSVAFAGDWGKVPVFTNENGEHFVDSTPVMKHIDAAYNAGKLAATGDAERQQKWLEWADAKVSKATVPILYGTLGSALKTTTRISKNREIRVHFEAPLCVGWLPNHVGHHCKEASQKGWPNTKETLARLADRIHK